MAGCKCGECWGGVFVRLAVVSQPQLGCTIPRMSVGISLDREKPFLMFSWSGDLRSTRMMMHIEQYHNRLC